MLQAVLQGKAGTINVGDDEVSVSWRDVFKAQEDLLSATVFGRFAYLSQSLQSTLVETWLKPDCNLGAFETIEFWPSYGLEQDLGKRRVEPDMVMRFTEANVLVEVKPPNKGAGQYVEQWKREVMSFIQSDEQHREQLHFLAIGRLNDLTDEHLADRLADDYREKLTSASTRVMPDYRERKDALKGMAIELSI